MKEIRILVPDFVTCDNIKLLHAVDLSDEPGFIAEIHSVEIGGPPSIENYAQITRTVFRVTVTKMAAYYSIPFMDAYDELVKVIGEGHIKTRRRQM